MLDYENTCEEAVRAAGAELQRWIGRAESWEKGRHDLATQADLAAQEVVRRIVLERFPHHCLLGEEGEHEPANDSQGYRWVVDPLDGTTNYVHRVPHYSVSLALEHQGRVLVGAVYDPNTDECFTAAAGRGAFLNGQPIGTSNVAHLTDALAAVGFPPDATRTHRDVAVFLAALESCQAIRRTGSAALNLCYLAAGRFDVYWSFSTKIWDVAAGTLMVQEAGGTISAPDGGEFVLAEARFLAAANPTLHAQLAELVRDALR